MCPAGETIAAHRRRGGALTHAEQAEARRSGAVHGAAHRIRRVVGHRQAKRASAAASDSTAWPRRGGDVGERLCRMRKQVVSSARGRRSVGRSICTVAASRLMCRAFRSHLTAPRGEIVGLKGGAAATCCAPGREPDRHASCREHASSDARSGWSRAVCRLILTAVSACPVRRAARGRAGAFGLLHVEQACRQRFRRPARDCSSRLRAASARRLRGAPPRRARRLLLEVVLDGRRAAGPRRPGASATSARSR